jgi:uracil-DNA glycosylase
MNDLGIFPFGNPVKKVEQKDRIPKKVFVLGVHSSAINVRWITHDEKTFVMALAIDNEPDIYWRGSPAYINRIINRLNFPEELGSLTPAHKDLNGAEGRALDYNLLEPLGLERKHTWLSNLIPFAIANKSQRKAIRKYTFFKDKFKLPTPTIKPDVIKSKLIDRKRIEEIAEEIKESKAELLITLGDLPLHHFVKYFDKSMSSLSSFEKYGKLHDVKITDKQMLLLPVVHPRQAGRKGKYSQRWYGYHDYWVENKAKEVLKDFEQI